MTLFNPDRQFDYTRDIRRVYLGTAPSIGVVSISFGANIAESWLEIQLRDLSEYAGCKDKMSESQIEQTAKVIISEWGYLKVTELMHFFVLFKSGKYGKFYGAVDSMVITEGMRKFVRERYELVGRLREEEEQREREAEKEADAEEVRKFKDALSVSNMTVGEWHRLKSEYGLTLDEVAELGWLLR